MDVSFYTLCCMAVTEMVIKTYYTNQALFYVHQRIVSIVSMEHCHAVGSQVKYYQM